MKTKKTITLQTPRDPQDHNKNFKKEKNTDKTPKKNTSKSEERNEVKK